MLFVTLMPTLAHMMLLFARPTGGLAVVHAWMWAVHVEMLTLLLTCFHSSLFRF